MPTQYQVTCTKCDYQSDLIWLSWTLYTHRTGTHELAKQLVWCPGCAQVTFAEFIHSLKTMQALAAIPAIKSGMDFNKLGCQWSDAEIEQVRAYTRYPGYRGFHDAVFGRSKWDIRQAVMLHGLMENHLRWRKARKSKAHCLTCGKMKFTPLPVSEDEIPMDTKHPGCGGTLKFKNKGTVKAKPYPYEWTWEGKSLGYAKPKTDF